MNENELRKIAIANRKGGGYESFKDFFEEYTQYMKEIGAMAPEIRAQIDRQFCIAITGGLDNINGNSEK